jgi:hypothetical protein
MHMLSRKNIVYEWTADCSVTFDELKELLITAPVLLHPRFEEFILDTDASGVSHRRSRMGMQTHPIA